MSTNLKVGLLSKEIHVVKKLRGQALVNSYMS